MSAWLGNVWVRLVRGDTGENRKQFQWPYLVQYFREINRQYNNIESSGDNEQVETETRSNYCIIRRCKTSLQSNCPSPAPNHWSDLRRNWRPDDKHCCHSRSSGHRSLAPAFSQPAPAQLRPQYHWPWSPRATDTGQHISTMWEDFHSLSPS